MVKMAPESVTYASLEDSSKICAARIAQRAGTPQEGQVYALDAGEESTAHLPEQCVKYALGESSQMQKVTLARTPANHAQKGFIPRPCLAPQGVWHVPLGSNNHPQE
jgi:hypothetical protein